MYWYENWAAPMVGMFHRGAAAKSNARSHLSTRRFAPGWLHPASVPSRRPIRLGDHSSSALRGRNVRTRRPVVAVIQRRGQFVPVQRRYGVATAVNGPLAVLQSDMPRSVYAFDAVGGINVPSPSTIGPPGASSVRGADSGSACLEQAKRQSTDFAFVGSWSPAIKPNEPSRDGTPAGSRRVRTPLPKKKTSLAKTCQRKRHTTCPFTTSKSSAQTGHPFS